ncbi:acetate/propionate family kinase [Paraburkholderia acidisoli]|uniref:Acetate kinase n=1 Tax=Paraburkholderia acidisoli TaxID=2571748 RepID=A0A7Z2GQD3_9BURK|nr:acetate/propionate family kinase [Paraburkholderia acidisoli]QGZ66061.1 acetate/propionate family kinase [Paraburkholderia acidisoli]
MSARDTVLALNSGSSSLKFALFAREAGDAGQAAAAKPIVEGSASGIGRDDGRFVMQAADGSIHVDTARRFKTQTEVLAQIAAAFDEHALARPLAVGHRVVHGGPHLREHCVLTAQVRETLAASVHFAPLHIPPALGLIDEATKMFGNAKQIACFDTAFHRTLPDRASHFALPRRYAQQGVIRYGFHGLSYESLVRRLGASLPARAVFAHLGNGSSLCAVQDGVSIDTTMGMTPTGGVPMGTRTGDLDPGVLLHLMRTEQLDADALETLVNHESGLAGLSGGESQMQTLTERAQRGDADAALAVEAFTSAVRKTVGAYAALMGGIDMLVFTGGIGEHSAEVRERVCGELGFLGLRARETNGLAANVVTLRAEEEAQIAEHCRALLA